MEAASTLIQTNQTYQSGQINHELSGRAPFFKFAISRFNEKNNVFKKLYSSHFLNFELKGHLLIIIMRPTASLTRCYAALKRSRRPNRKIESWS